MHRAVLAAPGASLEARRMVLPPGSWPALEFPGEGAPGSKVGGLGWAWGCLSSVSAPNPRASFLDKWGRIILLHQKATLMSGVLSLCLPAPPSWPDLSHREDGAYSQRSLVPVGRKLRHLSKWNVSARLRWRDNECLPLPRVGTSAWVKEQGSLVLGAGERLHINSGTGEMLALKCCLPGASPAGRINKAGLVPADKYGPVGRLHVGGASTLLSWVGWKMGNWESKELESHASWKGKYLSGLRPWWQTTCVLSHLFTSIDSFFQSTLPRCLGNRARCWGRRWYHWFHRA